jgi:hypothetical protein
LGIVSINDFLGKASFTERMLRSHCHLPLLLLLSYFPAPPLANSQATRERERESRDRKNVARLSAAVIQSQPDEN